MCAAGTPFRLGAWQSKFTADDMEQSNGGRARAETDENASRPGLRGKPIP